MCPTNNHHENKISTRREGELWSYLREILRKSLGIHMNLMGLGVILFAIARGVLISIVCGDAKINMPIVLISKLQPKLKMETDLTKQIKSLTHHFKPKLNANMRTIRWADEVYDEDVIEDYDDLMKEKGFQGNIVTDTFTFCKRGQNYGIKLSR